MLREEEQKEEEEVWWHETIGERKTEQINEEFRPETWALK